jgi:hypothetical protein
LINYIFYPYVKGHLLAALILKCMKDPEKEREPGWESLLESGKGQRTGSCGACFIQLQSLSTNA